VALSVAILGLDRHVVKMFFEEGFNIISKPSSADLLCFIGGNDINPQLYGQKKAHPAVHVDDSADKRDLDGWKGTTLSQLKVGICRGGQFLNVMNGGKMYQHVTGHDKSHMMYDTLTHDEFEVTSSHHQMMIPGAGAEILGYSENVGGLFIGEDGIAVAAPKTEYEVLWYERTNSLCYQPHPEWDDGKCREHFLNLIGLFR
jgi:hypothetical protein